MTQDQRQEFRLVTKAKVLIELYDEHSEQPVLLATESLDISANGVQLQCNRAISPFCIHPLKITIEQAQENSPDPQIYSFNLIAEIKWCTAKNTQEYLVGLSLYEAEQTDIQRWKEFIADSMQPID